MHQNHLTPTAQLMDIRLRAGGVDGVVDTIRRLNVELDSWRLVARELHGLAGVRVSHETVRGWAIEWGLVESETAGVGGEAA